MIYDSQAISGYEPDPVKRALHEMRDEFESHQLEVTLAPAPSPRHEMHMVRVLADQNVRWYRALCERHLSSRNRSRRLPDTRIKRRHISRTLAALIEGKDGGIYGPDLLSVARERAKDQPIENDPF